MTPNSILDVEVSRFRDYHTSSHPETVNLLDWLKSAKYAKEVTAIRKIDEKSERDRLKAKLPAITTGGLFSYRNTESIIKFSGFMQLDIDLTHNTRIRNFLDMQRFVSKVPYVAYCGLSVSGLGYWLLVPIKEAGNYLNHWNAMCQDWHNIPKIVFDPNRKDIAGLRGCSYDPNAYFNHSACLYTKLTPEAPERSSISSNYVTSGTASENVFEHARKILEGEHLPFAQGYRHNYIFRLCSILNQYGITQAEAENWIFSNLPISRDEVKSNCISGPYSKGKKFFGKFTFQPDEQVYVPFLDIESISTKAYLIRQETGAYTIPKSAVRDKFPAGCLVSRFIFDNARPGDKLPEYHMNPPHH